MSLRPPIVPNDVHKIAMTDKDGGHGFRRGDGHVLSSPGVLNRLLPAYFTMPKGSLTTFWFALFQKF
jgi:hypothetical protein